MAGTLFLTRRQRNGTPQAVANTAWAFAPPSYRTL